MNEFFEALKVRLSSPLLGFFTFAIIAFNWEAVFYLLTEDGKVLERIAYFDQHTTLWSLGIWPLMTAMVFSTVYPWVSLFLAWITSRPIGRHEALKLKAEHNLLLIKKELEEARSNIFAVAEEELIARAKRDQELVGIESNEARERVRAELDELRSQRDSMRQVEGGNVKGQVATLMDAANQYRQRSQMGDVSYEDKRHLLEQAKELEDRAHALLLNFSAP